MNEFSINVDGVDKIAHVVTRLEVDGTGIEYIYYHVDGEKDSSGDNYLFSGRVDIDDDGEEEIIEIESEEEKKIAFELFANTYKNLQ